MFVPLIDRGMTSLDTCCTSTRGWDARRLAQHPVRFVVVKRKTRCGWMNLMADITATYWRNPNLPPTCTNCTSRATGPSPLEQTDEQFSNHDDSPAHRKGINDTFFGGGGNRDLAELSARARRTSRSCASVRFLAR